MKFKNKYDLVYKKLLKTENILLGPQLSYEYIYDAKHLCFSLSRYKFVSKILEGTHKVLEVGAGDGFKSKIVSETVKNLTLSDYTDNYIKNNNINSKTNTQRYIVHNFEEKKLNEKFSAIYALDVIEHINKKNEHKFITNILHSLNKNGILIFGCPSIESQKYASPISKLGHINCKNKYELKNQMLKYFNFCFSFSMNDEVLHTGFDKLSHYILVVCCGKKA